LCKDVDDARACRLLLQDQLQLCAAFDIGQRGFSDFGLTLQGMRGQPIWRSCLDLEDRVALQFAFQVGWRITGEHLSLVDDRHAVA